MCVSRKLLPMTGVKSFILGFSISLFSVSLCGQQFFSAPSKKANIIPSSVKIDLFKKNDTIAYSPTNTLFANVTKQSLDIPVTNDYFNVSPFSSDGIEDDEILNLSTDSDIPIEYSVSSADDDNTAEVLDSVETEEKTAMLPQQDVKEDFSTPWIVAKGAPNIKNKKFAENLSKAHQGSLFVDDFQKTVSQDKAVSYKVAERIKQSIIFPIPDEILNDENLTPTFISNKKRKSGTSQPKTQPEKNVIPPASNDGELEIVNNNKVPNAPKAEEEDTKGFLDSISSWFSDKPSIEKGNSATHKRATPSYGTQDNDRGSTSLSKSSEDLASFYESMQTTKKEHHQRKIIPSELRLFFRPGKAEISGSTLRWLKTFSDAAQADDTFLQINLDATASAELQKKRLNLLYTILMNNGVDFRKVDTNFSLSEPNAFIIRTIKYQQTD